jgi:hypothetical protein
LDPITLAGSFATVVGLLANFKAERSGASLDEFMVWMREQHHESLAQSIEQNKKQKEALSVILSSNHDELVGRLQTITTQLSEIASHVEGFGELAAAMGGVSPLSPQACLILKQIAASPAKLVMQHKTQAGTNYLLMNGGNGTIQSIEPRFLEEDFESLVNFRYLRVEFASNGSPKYFITRAGTQAANAA